MNESQSKIDTNLNRWKDHFDGRAEALGRSPLANDHFTHRSFTITQRIVLEQIAGQQGKTILDIGCGNGLFMQPLLDSYHVYGIDISDKMCALSRSVGYREVLHNDCENIGFDKDFFDVREQHPYRGSDFVEMNGGGRKHFFSPKRRLARRNFGPGGAKVKTESAHLSQAVQSRIRS